MTVVTLFVRHSADCKYAGDEFWKRCPCRKHFRWTQNGTQHRRKAGTKSWDEAEEKKRKLEDALNGKAPLQDQAGPMAVREAVRLFLLEKKTVGISAHSLKYHYTRELNNLAGYMEERGMFTVVNLTKPVLTEFIATWEKACPSTYTRRVMQVRLRGFLLFCFNAGWIERAPKFAMIKNTSPDTLPLTDEEYGRLMLTAPGKVKTMIQLMRWSGLAVSDATLLKREDLVVDGNNYRIVRERKKTGSDLYIPIPPEIGKKVVAVVNSNPEYVFWNKPPETGVHAERKVVNKFSRLISLAFTDAKITSEGHMVSHRLRDTFAVDLLQKGLPLEHVSKLLGHKSVTTTERHYASWVKGRQQLLDTLVTATWKASSSRPGRK